MYEYLSDTPNHPINNSKTKKTLRSPPNFPNPKLSKPNPLVKKPINNPTTLKISLKKKFDEEISSANAISHTVHKILLIISKFFFNNLQLFQIFYKFHIQHFRTIHPQPDNFLQSFHNFLFPSPNLHKHLQNP